MKPITNMNRTCFFSLISILGTAFFLSTAVANDQLDGVIPLNNNDLNVLDNVMQANKPLMVVYPNTSDSDADGFNYALYPLSENQFQSAQSRIGMQIGMGGNPDVDNGKLFRNQAWNVSILYPVKQTHMGSLPTTIYIEVRCAGLGEQPVSAQTGNLNVRCGPGAVADVKLNSRVSAYSRLDIVTSRFSHNGAPVGQINPKTGKEFRLYQNNTGFTGAAIGVGVKVRVNSDTALFTEYTKYKVQQTDNPAYQFRGGWNFGIARKFWLFQGSR